MEINTNKSNARSSKRINDLLIARNLLLVVATDFMCWFPIGVMGMMALAGHVISGDVYVWACVLILPVNSAINPFLYTFLAVIRRKKFVPRMDEQAAKTEIDFSVVTRLLKMELFVFRLSPDLKTLKDYMNASDVTQQEVVSFIWMTTCRLSFLHQFNLCLGSLDEEKIIIYEENKMPKGMSLTIMPTMASNKEDKMKDIQLLGQMIRKMIICLHSKQSSIFNTSEAVEDKKLDRT